jgi:hypothetical protein
MGLLMLRLDFSPQLQTSARPRQNALAESEVIMEWLLFWLIASIVVGIIAAYAKGRSGAGWFLLALLLIGPLFAFILVLCLPRKQNQDELATCPACAETIKVQAKICKHCRTEIVWWE